MIDALAVSGGTLAAILVVVAIDLFALLFGLAFIRVRRAERAAAGTAAAGLPAPEEVPSRAAPRPLSRREFFRRSLVTSFGVFAAQFGGATIAFVWPNLKGGSARSSPPGPCRTSRPRSTRPASPSTPGPDGSTS